MLAMVALSVARVARSGQRGRAPQATTHGARFVSLVTAVAMLAAASTACGRREGTRVARSSAVAAGALTSITGAGVKELIAARHGRVVLVNVWATWCDPCREEFPDLLRVRRELGPQGLDVVLISADFASQLPQVSGFLMRSGVDFSTYFKTEKDEKFINALEPRWSGALPMTLLVARDGRRAGFWEGKTSYQTFVAKVRPLLVPQG